MPHMCRKANRHCSNCLPRRLGHCENLPTSTINLGRQRTPNELPGTTNDLRGNAIERPQAGDTITIPESQDFDPQQSHPGVSEFTQEHEHEAETPINPLPPFFSSNEPNFSWEDVDGETFSCALNGIYDETVH